MKAKKTTLSADFPAKLKTLRKSREWSQGQLAQKIGADLQRISKYERGVIWPTMELMVRIAKESSGSYRAIPGRVSHEYGIPAFYDNL